MVLFLPLPAPLPDGDYQLVLGIYSFSSGARAVAREQGLRQPDGMLKLATVRCKDGVCISTALTR